MRAMVVAPMLHAILTSKMLPADHDDGGYLNKDRKMSVTLSPMNAALSALAGLNDVTSQMTDAQSQISTGKAVNSYSDNPAVFFTATNLTNQQNVLKQSATMLNSNLSSITGAQGSLKTIQDALTQINTALTGLADQTATQATRNALAQTIQNEAAALTSAIDDDAANASNLGRGSLIAGGPGNGGLVVNLGNGQQMNIAGANMTIQAAGAGNLGFSAADIASIVKLAQAGTVADNTATAAAAASAPAGTTSTSAGTFSTSIVYADASGNTKDANGNNYSATTTAAGVALRSVTTFTPTSGGGAEVVGVDTPPAGTAAPSTGSFTVTNVYTDASGSVTNPATGRAYTATDAASNANVKLVGQGVASNLSVATFKYTPVTVAPSAATAAGQLATNTVGNVTTTVANAYADANGVTINPKTGAAYTAADAAAANSGIALRQVTTTTTLGLPSYIANLQAAVQGGLANANAFGRVLGGAANAINTVLNNNNNLQSTLSSQISSLVDADVAAEQVKLQALQVQQQLSVSALSSINQSRQALLSLFR